VGLTAISAASRFICETADMNLATAPTEARHSGICVGSSESCGESDAAIGFD